MLAVPVGLRRIHQGYPKCPSCDACKMMYGVHQSHDKPADFGTHGEYLDICSWLVTSHGRKDYFAHLLRLYTMGISQRTNPCTSSRTYMAHPVIHDLLSAPSHCWQLRQQKPVPAPNAHGASRSLGALWKHHIRSNFMLVVCLVFFLKHFELETQIQMINTGTNNVQCET